MRKAVVAIIAGTLVAIGMIVFAKVQHEKDFTFTIDKMIYPGNIDDQGVSIKRVPGVLTFQWASEGKVFDGYDDTIAALRLEVISVDPVARETLYSVWQASHGEGTVRCIKPGYYGFWIDNRGPLRSTLRQVKISGRYRAD